MCNRGKSREDPCISVKSKFVLYLRYARGHAVVHHPFGAVVARPRPFGASDDGGEGWSIPLVSQSEPVHKGIAIKAIMSP